MALIKCPECGREISDKAVSCPGCGCPASEFSHIEKEEEKLCPFCGEKLVLEDGYCSSCGIKYTEEQAYDKKRIVGLGGAIEYDKKMVSIESPIGNTLIRDQITAFSFDYTGNNLFIRHKAFKGPVTIELKTKNDILEIMNILNSNPQNSINTDSSKSFKGVYRHTIFGKIEEVYCPRCGSENCSHYYEQKFIPGKTKTQYSVNLNPLKPFTIINRKEKILKKDKTVTEHKFTCNECGNIF